MSKQVEVWKEAEMSPWQSLANAIVICAAKDYRRALRRIRKKPTNKEALSEIADIERFFCSDWYKTLTDVDGEIIIRRLREEHK